MKSWIFLEDFTTKETVAVDLSVMKGDFMMVKYDKCMTNGLLIDCQWIADGVSRIIIHGIS